MITERRYGTTASAGFRRTAEAFGGFSNMAGGYTFHVNGHLIRSTEAFYQAARYPMNPAAQEKILAQKSPMMAKRVAYEFIEQTRKDWESVNIAVMRHGLRLKTQAHLERISALMRQSLEMPIVEISNRDDFWGAKPQGDGSFLGGNVLGRLWMELRVELASDPERYSEKVAVPDIATYLLLGEPITDVVLSRSAEVQAGFGF